MRAGQLRGKMLGLALVTLGAAVILAYYWTAAGGKLPFAEHRYTVEARVAEPQGLQKHADVRASGVKVGTVDDIRPVGSGARIKLRLKETIAPLYRDATVLVRQKTLVGENYIELTRGHPKAGRLPDGARLPISRDREAVPLDRILNSLDAKTRAHISGSLRSMGAGTAGRGSDINDLLAALQPTLSQGSQVTAVLDGQRTQVADLVEQSSTILAAIDNRRNEIRTLVRSARVTARTVASRDRELRETFRALPGALAQARTSVRKLSAFSNTATPVVEDLRTGLVGLTPALHDLKPTADQAQVLFDELPALLKVADPMLTRLREFSSAAAPAFPPLDRMLREANPALAYLKPYSRDVTGFLANFGLNHFYDSAGALGYCTCPVSDRSFSNWTPTMRKAAGVLLDQGVLAKINHVENNPLRPPGQLPRADVPFRGDYPRLRPRPQP